MPGSRNPVAEQMASLVAKELAVPWRRVVARVTLPAKGLQITGLAIASWKLSCPI